MIAASQYDQIERAATEQLKTSSADAQVSLLELITNLGLRSQRLLQAVLPLLVSKDASVRRSSFAAIHQLAGVSNKAGLERLMADMGLIQESTVHDEVQSHIQSNSCTRSFNFVFATASCLFTIWTMSGTHITVFYALCITLLSCQYEQSCTHTVMPCTACMESLIYFPGTPVPLPCLLYVGQPLEWLSWTFAKEARGVPSEPSHFTSGKTNVDHPFFMIIMECRYSGTSHGGCQWDPAICHIERCPYFRVCTYVALCS